MTVGQWTWSSIPGDGYHGMGYHIPSGWLQSHTSLCMFMPIFKVLNKQWSSLLKQLSLRSFCKDHLWSLSWGGQFQDQSDDQVMSYQLFTSPWTPPDLALNHCHFWNEPVWEMVSTCFNYYRDFLKWWYLQIIEVNILVLNPMVLIWGSPPF